MNIFRKKRFNENYEPSVQDTISDFDCGYSPFIQPSGLKQRKPFQDISNFEQKPLTKRKRLVEQSTMIPQHLIPGEKLDYSTEVAQTHSDPLRLQLLVNIILPAAVKGTIIQMAMSWVFGIYSPLKSLTVFLYFLSCSDVQPIFQNESKEFIFVHYFIQICNNPAIMKNQVLGIILLTLGHYGSNIFMFYIAVKISQYVIKESPNDPHFILKNGFQKNVKQIQIYRYVQFILATMMIYGVIQILGLLQNKLINGIKLFITLNICSLKQWAFTQVSNVFQSLLTLMGLTVQKQTSQESCLNAETSPSLNYDLFNISVFIIEFVKQEIENSIYHHELQNLVVDTKSEEFQHKLIEIKWMHFRDDQNLVQMDQYIDDFNEIETLIARIKNYRQTKSKNYENTPEIFQYLFRQRDIMVSRYELGQILDLYLKQCQLFWYQVRYLAKKGIKNNKIRQTQKAILLFYQDNHTMWHQRFGQNVEMMRALREAFVSLDRIGNKI